MDNFYARSVFFVKDAERSLAFYTETFGFKLDWNYQEEGRAWVFQVSLFGFELILNQVHENLRQLVPVGAADKIRRKRLIDLDLFLPFVAQQPQ